VNTGYLTIAHEKSGTGALLVGSALLFKFHVAELGDDQPAIRLVHRSRAVPETVNDFPVKVLGDFNFAFYHYRTSTAAVFSRLCDKNRAFPEGSHDIRLEMYSYPNIIIAGVS